MSRSLELPILDYGEVRRLSQDSFDKLPPSDIIPLNEDNFWKVMREFETHEDQMHALIDEYREIKKQFLQSRKSERRGPDRRSIVQDRRHDAPDLRKEKIERRQGDRRGKIRRSREDRRHTPVLNALYLYMKTQHEAFVRKTRALFDEIYKFEIHDEVSEVTFRPQPIPSSDASESPEKSPLEV